jgi:hypothetical protein
MQFYKFDISLADLIGSVGVAILVIAFFLNLIDKLNSRSVIYSLMNTIGAGFAATASYMIHYWPFIVLEGVWTVVSLIGLFRAMRRKSKQEIT